MLTETISRTNQDGSSNDISLLEGFLNPPSYTDGGAAGPLTSAQAAGSVIMGMSTRSAKEVDEFTTGRPAATDSDLVLRVLRAGAATLNTPLASVTAIAASSDCPILLA